VEAGVTAELLTALATFSTALAAAAGGAVAWLWRQVIELRNESERRAGESAEREQVCLQRIRILRRRFMLTWDRLLALSRETGHEINGPYITAIHRLDREEAEIEEAFAQMEGGT
jgi:hypothetical protein